MGNSTDSRLAADDLAPIRRITQNLIVLARVSPNTRVLVAGTHSAVVFNELYRRRCVGFIATVAGATSGCKQYDVAIVPWYHIRLDGLDVTLKWLVRSLHRRGALAIWIAREEDKAGRKLHNMLDRVSFHIEAGTSCENGLAVVVRRDEVASLAIAA